MEKQNPTKGKMKLVSLERLAALEETERNLRALAAYDLAHSSQVWDGNYGEWTYGPKRYETNI